MAPWLKIPVMPEHDTPLRAAIVPPYQEDSGPYGNYYDGNDNERNDDFVEMHRENVHGSSSFEGAGVMP
jgi:hypothetical protein